MRHESNIGSWTAKTELDFVTLRVVVQADLSTIHNNEYSYAFVCKFIQFCLPENYSYETTQRFIFLVLIFARGTPTSEQISPTE